MLSIVWLGWNLWSISSECISLSHEEGWPLNTIHHHEVFTGLWHGLVSLALLFQELVETFHLLVLFHHIVNVIDFQLGYLSNFLLVLLTELLLFILLIICERRAYLVLTLKHLELNIITPKKHLERTLLRQALNNSLMEVMECKGVFGQEVLNVILEGLLLLVIFPVFNWFHKCSLLKVNHLVGLQIPQSLSLS